MKQVIIILLFLLSFITNVDGQTLNQFMQEQMEPSCQAAYKACFSGRSYIKNSLRVQSVVVEGNRIHVKGKHNYTGYLGAAYTDVDFKADITIEGKYVHIVFYKWFTPLIGDGHWESCERTNQSDLAQIFLDMCKTLYESE